MDNYINTNQYGNDYNSFAVSSASLIKTVYLWMTGALAITGLTAWYVANNAAAMSFIFGHAGVMFGLIIAELALVIGLSRAIDRLSPMAATLMFLLYSVVNGATLASIFVIYELGTIASAFFTTAATFGVMAIFGAVTKRDLTKVGSICIMAVIGLIIAMLVNIFLKSTMFEMIISVIGVLVFTGLTAYDSQKIKELLYNAPENDETLKISILGALTLYLDFINLFLYILRFFGRRN